MGPSAAGRVQVVLLDALGTLVELQPPAPRLRGALRELAGVDVGEEAAARGFAAEVEHYRASHLRGSDEAGLEALRDDCAVVLRDALGEPSLDFASVRQAMLDALEFQTYPG